MKIFPLNQHNYSRDFLLEALSISVVGGSILFSSVRFVYGDISLSLISVIIILFLCYVGLARHKKVLRGLTVKNMRAFLPEFSFIAIFGIAVLMTGTVHAWGVYIEWFILPFLFFLVISQSLSRYKHISKNLMRFLLGGVIITSLPFLFFDLTTFDDRLYGLWPSPNHLGLFMTPLLVAVFFLVVFAKNKYIQVFDANLCIVGFLVLIQTKSAAAVLSLCIVLGVFWGIIVLQDVKKRKYFLGSIVGMFILLLIVSMTFQGRINDLIENTERSSLMSRLTIWHVSFDLLRHNPVSGIGVGIFQESYLSAQKYYEPYLEWAVPHPHNLFLTMWLYGGIISLIAFLYIILKRVYYMGKAIVQKNTTSIIFGSALCVILFQGMVDTSYFRIDLAYLFWLAYFSR